MTQTDTPSTLPQARSPLAALRRPKLLIRAARLGLADYSRTRDLRRIMRTGAVPTPSNAVAALMNTEAELEECRRSGTSTYSVIRHVEVMIALMAEARLLPSGPRGA